MKKAVHFEVEQIENGLIVTTLDESGFIPNEKTQFCAHAGEAAFYVRDEVMKFFKDVQV